MHGWGSRIHPQIFSPPPLHLYCDYRGSEGTMLSILRKARLKDKEMRILMLYGWFDAPITID